MVGTLKMRPKSCHETSVRKYHCRLRKNLKEGRSRSHRDGIPKLLKSSVGFVSFHLKVAKKFQRVAELFEILRAKRNFCLCFFRQNIRIVPLGSDVCDNSGHSECLDLPGIFDPFFENT